MLHPKIKELQLRAKPINYSSVGVNQMGQLAERSSLLDQRIVEGYGCIWGSKNDYGEIFVKGCFSKSIEDLGPGSNSNYQIKFRDNHGKACALFEVLKEDEIGLYFKTKPLDAVEWCDELLVQLRSGTINNFSNGFKYVWDRIEYNAEEDALMMIEARLFEISAVVIPSDMETFAIRSMEEPEYLADDVEDFIVSLPRSKQLEARKIFTRCMSPIEKITPLEARQQAPGPEAPAKTGIDYNYLTKNFKLS